MAELLSQSFDGLPELPWAEIHRELLVGIHPLGHPVGQDHRPAVEIAHHQVFLADRPILTQVVLVHGSQLILGGRRPGSTADQAVQLVFRVAVIEPNSVLVYHNAVNSLQ